MANMSWEPVNTFIEHLEPVREQDFETWFDSHWTPHYQKCLGAAKHVYIMEISLKESTSLETLKSNLIKHAKELGFHVEEFMDMAWPRAQQKFKTINDDE